MGKTSLYQCLSVMGLLMVSLAGGLAAEPAATNPPPRRFPMAVRSPEIQPDRTVTFRLAAPRATEVSVSGQWANGRAAMQRGSNGVWSVTVGPLEPGIYEYSFSVDGLTMIDPGNPSIKPMREPRTSILHLPGNPPQVFDFQPVPHGTVRHHTYFSRPLGRQRELVVYTPPDYDQSRTKYPVLYLQHGMGDNHATWTVHGKAHWILDNLIAQKRAKPMLIVMMDGHAAISMSGGLTNNTVMFERDLLEEVVPFVEANYRVRKEAASRALVGLSMGGGQALMIGLNHLDIFGWVGGFSSATPSREAIKSALEKPEVTNRRLKLLWIACGRSDFLIKLNQDFVSMLESQGIRHDWVLTEGGHTWPVWRTYLAELAPRLFR
ncbi:alpha/beta hydrolase-fold protein [Fontisphaera persica]|uniref:esterase n=1 Tax=Fontisphaera persica TaxID=2974023 RepID=UPI0024BF6003|nr:esterase [Fontisphaera persica]WCJ60371.1 alpha/beta hydrolase-fold protein [Fontisphaera persica]